MKEYVYENLEICSNAFQELLLSDKYLSSKDLEQFLDRYKDSFDLITKGYIPETDIVYKRIKSITNDGFNVIERRNKFYLDRKLKELSEYFDHLFDDIDDSIILDEEQRKAIICDDDYSLIVSFPGTGKTTMALAKIKYLVEKKNVKPEEVIYTCSTKEEKEEISKILKEDFNLDILVLTFEELEIKFLEDTYNKDYVISNYEDMKKVIEKYLVSYIFPNKEKLKYLMSIFSDRVFLENYALDYITFDEYYRVFVYNAYEEHKSNIEKYIMRKMNSLMHQYVSIRGEHMRNQSEVEIANYLYLNGYNYNYLAKDKKGYIPDFELIFPNSKAYIEYYSLTSIKKDGTYTASDSRVRRNLKKKQKALKTNYPYSLIELYSNTNYLEILDQELKKYNHKNIERSKKEVFMELYENNKTFQLQPLIELLTKFINRFKEKGYTLNDFDYLIKKEYKENLKKKLILVRDIYEYYEEYLEMNDMIDFNDLITKASNVLDRYKHENKNIKYSYLIIDDYQYISLGKTSFAKKISTLFNTKIIALGDDWESIYALNSSDINMFKDFYNIMGYANIMRIGNLYRSSREILDVASNYIGDSFNMYSKELVSLKHTGKPIEINYYEEDNIDEKNIVLSSIINKIHKQNKSDKILILGLYKDDIYEYIESGLFKMGKDGLLEFSDIPSTHIYYKTIGESKGLEFDQVILLDTSYKCDFENDELLKLLDNVSEEVIDSIEERRIFYIALTRTKNKLYMIESYKNNHKNYNDNENISIIVKK